MVWDEIVPFAICQGAMPDSPTWAMPDAPTSCHERAAAQAQFEHEMAASSPPKHYTGPHLPCPITAESVEQLGVSHLSRMPP